MYGIAKLFFSLKTRQSVYMEEAALIFDKGLRTLIKNMVICGRPFFGDLQWRLASLPIRFGGLGRAGKPPKPFIPTPVIFTPETVVALSAHTCVTRSEDTVYYHIANALDVSVFKILDPATGVADEAFKASIIKRYRDGAASGKNLNPLYGVFGWVSPSVITID
ncbi:reverse transcriptase domain-containing protein [Artemisia annua]|uniref:Reverse transcriptase domain-containing protein n=1 Tax=Artemisia annua TaxID=35608 RepID=A0A2U1NRS8_ARTAN|nr:reverse transcriptase domain-containing protein [Artemisia annua]